MVLPISATLLLQSALALPSTALQALIPELIALHIQPLPVGPAAAAGTLNIHSGLLLSPTFCLFFLPFCHLLSCRLTLKLFPHVAGDLFVSLVVANKASQQIRCFWFSPTQAAVLFRYGWNGFQCGVCPYSSQCYYDSSVYTYYRCSTSTTSLSPVGIAMICVGIFVFIVIVVVIAVIRRRRAYTTVEYTPGYGATVSTQPYPYYAPPVIVEPAPVIVSDFGHHHHHHHHGGSSYAAVGFSGGGGNAAVGFSGGGGGGNAAVGFSS